MAPAALLAITVALLAVPTWAAPLVGPSVGSEDVLLTEGNRLYDLQNYKGAVAAYLKANRVNPKRSSTYLLLARSYKEARLLPQACYAFGAYLKAASNETERTEARANLERCRQELATEALRLKQRPQDFSLQFIAVEARFAAALHTEGKLLGPDSASTALESLVRKGYLDVRLADMARQLHQAAVAAVEEIYRDSLAGRERPLSDLQQGSALYTLALETGEPPPNHRSHTAFLSGLAELRQSRLAQAEKLFAQASTAEPTVAEYRLLRAKAIGRGGDRARALQVLNTELPEDPRTRLTYVSQALSASPEQGAAALEAFCFQYFGKSM